MSTISQMYTLDNMRCLQLSTRAKLFSASLYIYSAGLVTKPCPILATHGLQPAGLLCPWDFPGRDTGVGCHFLLQWIFPSQESNPGLMHCRWTPALQVNSFLSHEGSHLHLHLYPYLYLAVPMYSISVSSLNHTIEQYKGFINYFANRKRDKNI